MWLELLWDVWTTLPVAQREAIIDLTCQKLIPLAYEGLTQCCSGFMGICTFFTFLLSQMCSTFFCTGQSSTKGKKKCLFSAWHGHPFPYFIKLFTWMLYEALGQGSGDGELSTLLVFRVSPIMTHWSVFNDWQRGICSRNDIMFTGIFKGLGHLNRIDIW